jgi:hypothetical protein
MRHIFTSGEEIYGKTKKQLDQGEFIIKHIDYEDICEETLFEAGGTIEGKLVSVDFKIKSDSFSDIKFRNSVKILMLSDLVLAEWDHYTLTYT